MEAASSDLRCVLFDAVGTLIYPDPPVAAAYGEVARQFGSSLSEAEIGRRFREAFHRQEARDAGGSGSVGDRPQFSVGDRPQRFETDEDREERRWRTIVAEVFDDVADAAPLFSKLWMHFAQPQSWRLFDDVADAWRRLAARGLMLGVASNFDGRLRQVCGGLPPLDRAAYLFVSSELGVRKPSPDFFRRVEAGLRLPAARILLVGDDLENDYLAAQAAGWQAIHLDRSGEQRSGANTIRSLNELA